MADAFALANAFVRIRPDATGFRAEADAKLQAALAGLKPNVKLNASTDAAKIVLGDLRAYVEKLTSRVYELRVGLNDKTLQAQLTKDLVLLERLNRKVEAGVTLRGATQMQAQLLAVDASIDRTEAKLMGATAAAAGFGGVWSFLLNRTKIPLFGGGQALAFLPKFITQIGSLHLLVDILAEFLAVLVPVTYALAAFGLAGVDAFRAVFHQMQNFHTVMDAEGKSIPPFTSNLEKMHDAVRPAVFSLLGDAMTIVNSKTKEFNKLATDSAGVMQEFGARIAVAIKTGGISEFLKNAADDLHGVMDVFGNLFGILGNFLHSMPGIAQNLLHLTEGFTHFVEVLTGTRFVQGITRFGLLAHGALIYIGLGATIAGKTVEKSLGLVENLAVSAARSFGKLGSGGAAAAKGMSTLAGWAARAARLPWGWIAAAAVGVGILVFKLVTMKTATQQWTSALDAMMKRQDAVSGFITLLEQQALVSHRLATSTASLRGATVSLAQAQQATGDKSGRALLTFYRNAKEAQAALTDAQKTQVGQISLYVSRMAMLGRAFGGVGEAQGLLIASGVTMDDMLKQGSHAWDLIFQRVTATVQGYKLMGQTGGALGADMNAMNIVINDQYTAMQKLNQTWDTLMGVISGGEGNFLSFEQNIISVNEALAQVGGTSRTVNKTFDEIKAAAKGAGVSMNGLNPASLQLRQTWQTAFNSAQPLIDALRNMASVREGEGGFPSVTRAIKDMIKQLVQVGSTGKESRNELVALAQEVNPNITNFKELTKWLGNTKGAGKDLDKLVTAMGGNIKDLAKDAASLSDTLKNDLIAQFDAAKIASSGAGRDIKTMAGDIVNNSSAAKRHHDADRLYLDFRRAGLDAKSAQRLIETMTGQIFKIPHNWRTDINAYGHGHGKITYAAQTAGRRADGTLEFHRRGTRIPGYGGGDSVAAMLEPGETVVPKHLTPLIAPLMHRHHVPGFASGGFVGVNTDMQRISPFMIDELRRFEGNEMVLFMKQAVASAKAMAKAASRALVPSSNALGGDQAANKRLARSMFPWGGQAEWGSFVALEMAEAGFNRFARNPSSGAYGIPQALPPTKMPFAAQAAGGSHAGPQLSWMYNYISGRYGDPIRAWAHEVAYHWYNKGGLVKNFDHGGWLMPGATLAVNRTGRAERVIPGGGGGTLIVKVDPAIAAVTPDRKLGQHIAQHVLMHTKGGGRLYPPGTAPK